MERKIASAIMLTMLLIGMLTLAFNGPPIVADAITAGLSDDSSTVMEADADNLSNPKKSQESSLSKDFNQNTSAKENRKPYSVDEDGWNFNKTNEWANFAKVDDDSAELVIGVNSGKPNSYADIAGLIDENSGKLVGTVSIRGEVRAVVADIPFVAISSFVTEVQAAGLSCYIEPNMRVQTCLVPNDPYWPQQWGPRIIEADYAWNTTIGDPSVLVAVVDTGIYYTHSDLAANYVALGYDWVNMDADPMDDHGHGTHCAGIIAAVLNNGIGIAGLAQVRVMAEKVLDSGGGGEWEWVANGIIHATDCGANIISMSLGGYGYSELVHEAVKYAYDSGVLVIAAAGNENTNMKLYPAGYDEVIAVAATDQYDNKAWFSNWGDWIELAAPGVDIYSTVPWGYESWSGTSMACPHVAGVAALVWSRHPNKTNDWVRLWLRYTADDLGEPGFDVYYGYGRVNARKAVEQTPPAHELIAYEWRTPPYVEPGAIGAVNATILNSGENNETDVIVQLLANDTIVDSTMIDFLASGNSTTVNLLWNPTVEGLYNVTLHVVPVPGETILENNVLWKYIYVGLPLKAVVLHSAGNVHSDIITNWQVLSSEWHMFGDTMVYIDYTTLNKEDITYTDIMATEADVLIISCAYDPYAGWEFTDSEIEAIEQYVHEGHGLIATAGTLYDWVPNNNKLAPLFGLNETTRWDATWTDLLHLVNKTHPIFTNVPNPLVFPQVGTALPYDGRWDSNELVGGKYLALGHYQESAIVTYRGLAYISPWLEVIPPYYHHHLQLLYNAITWSRYQKPEHEVVVSLECPLHLVPGESTLLNATVSNMGLSNETNVELYLSIDSIVVNSTIISELLTGESYTINHLWTPTVETTYNVTVYALPVFGEDFTGNNIETKMVFVMLIAGHIVFEEAHLSAYTIGSNPAAFVTGGYSEFANYLTAFGYTVSTIDPGTTIDLGILAPVDVLVIVAPQNSYLTSEIDAIEIWVKGGGKLLLISDWGPFGPQTSTIAATFNLDLKLDALFDSDDNVGPLEWIHYDGTNLCPHRITAGVTRVEMYCGDGILSTPADEIPLIVTDSDGTATWASDGSPALGVSVMSAIDGGTAGSGRLIIITDSNVWDSAHDVDGDGDLDFYDSDNEVLALNSIYWLAVKYEHDLAVSLDLPASLELGNSAILNATVRNRGLNNETNVELYLLINSAVVSSATIPELLVGQSYTINYLWTPTITKYYNITSYAPPVLDEEDLANNIVTKFVPVWFYMRLYLPNEWVGGGTSMGWHADDNSWSYTLPFDFQFYGTYYRTVYISSNGLIAFIGPDSSYSNSIPALTEKLAIAPAWDDWVTYSPHDIYIWQNSTHVGIRWDVAAYYDNSIIANFEAILRADGVIQFNYAYNNGPISATIGISNGADHILAEDVTSLNYIHTIMFTPFQPEHELVVHLEAPTLIEPGSSTLLNATVLNNGLSNETSVDLFLFINGTAVNSTTIPQLLIGEHYTINYLWTPTLETTYNVTAYAPPVSGENITVNNFVSQIAYVRHIIQRDVAIISVTTSATEVYEGQIVNIIVVAKNEGNVTENFDVIAYYDASIIGIQTVIDLTAGANVTLTFGWNTAGVTPRIIGYTIKAVATQVPDEIDTDDNTYVDGNVKVKMLGDVNGDGIINIQDIVIAALAFGSQPGDPNWNPVADLNRDGIVNIVDLVIIGIRFGEHLS